MNERVTQNEYDQWCEEHGVPWKLVKFATPQELAAILGARKEQAA